MAREPTLIAAALKAATYHGDSGAGFKNADRRNLYQCERDPSHMIVTVDLEPGVTPFLIGCDRCKEQGERATMKSSFYMVHPQAVATHEWYRPDSMEGFSQWEREHLGNGGLLLRKREGSSSTEEELASQWHATAELNEDQIELTLYRTADRGPMLEWRPSRTIMLDEAHATELLGTLAVALERKRGSAGDAS